MESLDREKDEAIHVTQVLDYFMPPELVEWKLDEGRAEANRIGKKAMKIGTRVDELIKNEGQPKKSDSVEVQSCFKAYEKFREDYKPVSVKPCKRLYFEMLGFKITGEPDLDIAFPNYNVLTDIKGSNRIDIKHWIQDTVYASVTGHQKVAILRLDKITEDYHFYERDYNEHYVNVFKGLLLAYVTYKGGFEGYGDQRIASGSH